jgi:hypothetical protein
VKEKRERTPKVYVYRSTPNTGPPDDLAETTQLVAATDGLLPVPEVAPQAAVVSPGASLAAAATGATRAIATARVISDALVVRSSIGAGLLSRAPVEYLDKAAFLVNIHHIGTDNIATKAQVDENYAHAAWLPEIHQYFSFDASQAVVLRSTRTFATPLFRTTRTPWGVVNEGYWVLLHPSGKMAPVSFSVAASKGNSDGQSTTMQLSVGAAASAKRLVPANMRRDDYELSEDVLLLAPFVEARKNHKRTFLPPDLPKDNQAGLSSTQASGPVVTGPDAASTLSQLLGINMDGGASGGNLELHLLAQLQQATMQRLHTKETVAAIQADASAQHARMDAELAALRSETATNRSEFRTGMVSLMQYLQASPLGLTLPAQNDSHRFSSFDDAPPSPPPISRGREERWDERHDSRREDRREDARTAQRRPRPLEARNVPASRQTYDRRDDRREERRDAFADHHQARREQGAVGQNPFTGAPQVGRIDQGPSSGPALPLFDLFKSSL